MGPYVIHGEPLVAARVAAGTDYADLTGETEFVDRMYVRHHTAARASGVRLVHACGFDSVAHDLGALFTVERLPEGVPLRVDGFVWFDTALSGGTPASVLAAVSRPAGMARAALDRRRVEARPTSGRTIRAPLGAPVRSGVVGCWGLPLPTLDAQVIARSASALGRYGPDFRYRHYAGAKSLRVALGAVALAGAAQLPPARRWMAGRIAPGTGPSRERRERSWFSLRFVGTGGDERVVTEVAGGDPGYEETAKILAESRLSLAFDDLPDVAGQVTTAVAMGGALTERLRRAGVTFRVVSRATRRRGTEALGH